MRKSMGFGLVFSKVGGTREVMAASNLYIPIIVSINLANSIPIALPNLSIVMLVATFTVVRRKSLSTRGGDTDRQTESLKEANYVMIRHEPSRWVEA
jgi:hypothetical protein